MFPRLCVLGLQLAQPFLIQESVSYVEAARGPESRNIGYGLIGAYGLVYIGIAVCCSSIVLVSTVNKVSRSAQGGTSI